MLKQITPLVPVSNLQNSVNFFGFIELSRKSAEITNQVFCATGLSEKQADTMISLCKKIVD